LLFASAAKLDTEKIYLAQLEKLKAMLRKMDRRKESDRVMRCHDENHN
jgi:hypothetical protein